MKNLIDLTGKKIIVTGASSGIGQSIAVLCSQIGAEVILVARREDRLKETLAMMEQGNHTYFVADLSQTEKIAGLVGEMVERVGKIDGFVHAAGVTATTAVVQADILKYEQLMRVNYYAFVEMFRALSKRKCSNDGMSVVGISSSAVVDGKACMLYAATKAAMETFAAVAQRETVPKRRIRINTIRPHFVKTEMTDDYFENYTEEQLLDLYPLGVLQKDDIAICACFFLSDASSKIANQNLLIDSGTILCTTKGMKHL